MKNLSTYLKFTFLLTALIATVLQGCKKEEDKNLKPAPPVTYDRGDILQTHILGEMTAEDVKKMLNDAGVLVPFALKNDVKILSVSYATVDARGHDIIASGAFFIPQGLNDLPLLSLQHGTETKRNLVASVSANNSSEGLIGLITASLGYLTVVPDYPGFGVSNIMHPYLHAASLIPSVVDFMRAGKSYCVSNQINLNGRVFLTGYSEGGYVTLLTQKAIEENYANEFELTGVAPLSGPYNLKGMMDTIFHSETYGTPAYIAYFLTAYDHIYGWDRLDDFFKAPYAAMMPTLFNGSKTWGEVINSLPANFNELMNPVFISDFKNDLETEVLTALEENTLLDWKPKTPMHFFHGDADNIVPYYNVLTAIEKFKSQGNNDIKLTTIPGGTHESSGPVASIEAIHWFDSFPHES